MTVQEKVHFLPILILMHCKPLCVIILCQIVHAEDDESQGVVVEAFL